MLVFTFLYNLLTYHVFVPAVHNVKICYMVPWYNIFLDKFVVSQLLQKFYDFMIPENSSQNQRSLPLYHTLGQLKPVQIFTQ
jgi:hypothetical protein